jgi:CheY-like chemotaxis protein
MENNLAGSRILVVEDESALRLLLAEFLRLPRSHILLVNRLR